MRLTINIFKRESSIRDSPLWSVTTSKFSLQEPFLHWVTVRNATLKLVNGVNPFKYTDGFVTLVCWKFTVSFRGTWVYWMKYPSTKGEGWGNHFTCTVEEPRTRTEILSGGFKGSERQRHV